MVEEDIGEDPVGVGAWDCWAAATPVLIAWAGEAVCFARRLVSDPVKVALGSADMVVPEGTVKVPRSWAAWAVEAVRERAATKRNFMIRMGVEVMRFEGCRN